MPKVFFMINNRNPEKSVRDFIQRHGLKLCWIARSLGIDEALLRYHIKEGNEVILAQFVALIRAHAKALIDDLEEFK